MSRQNLVDKDLKFLRRIQDVGISLPSAAPAVDTSLLSTVSTSRPCGLDSTQGTNPSHSVRSVTLLNQDIEINEALKVWKRGLQENLEFKVDERVLYAVHSFGRKRLAVPPLMILYHLH